jgi:hypothetical protein
MGENSPIHPYLLFSYSLPPTFLPHSYLAVKTFHPYFTLLSSCHPPSPPLQRPHLLLAPPSILLTSLTSPHHTQSSLSTFSPSPHLPLSTPVGILCPLLWVFAEYMNDIPVTILLLLLAFMGCLVGGPNNIITSAVAADLADDPSIKGNNKVINFS